MNGKFIFLVLLVLAGIGGSYAIFLDQDMESLRTKTIIARQNTTNLQSQIDQLKQQMQNKVVAAELMKTVAAQTEENARLEALLKEEEAKYQPLIDAHREAIAQVRRETVGRSFDELTLANGTVLKSAVINEVSEDEIVIKHSLGIRRASSKDWPVELKDRLLPGALADTKPVAAATPATPPVMPADTPGGGESEAFKKHKKKLLEAELATVKMRQDLEVYQKQLQQVEEELRNNPSASRKYFAEQRRSQISAQVLSQTARLNVAEVALRRLQAEQPPQ